MELHSYAKRRTPKKWTIEQKRKLVEVRIAHDGWFVNKPSSVVPWKNILIAANLDDFNVFFVRKQWSNMLARYKQYKQAHLGNNISSKSIDAELIKRINQEWEFFEPIHKFMTRKTTNLHSYALTHRIDDCNSEQHEKVVEEQVQASAILEQEQCRKTISTPMKSHNETITVTKPKDCAKENIPNNTTIVLQSNISPDVGIHLFSSDTNEEFQIMDDATRIMNKSKGRKLKVAAEDHENYISVRNTDHDFYSKRSLGEIAVKDVFSLRKHDDELQEQQSNYFADASEESQGSSNVVIDLLQTNNTTNLTAHVCSTTGDNGKFEATVVKIEKQNSFDGDVEVKQEILEQEFFNDMPSTSTDRHISQNMEHPPQLPEKRCLSERDKYYRHKRRFNRRLERRFDAILQVMGQVVKTGYPNVDITPLVGTINSMASSIGQVLSSDSEDDNRNDY